MVTREDLKRMEVLQGLTDEMLDKLIPLIDSHRYDQDEVVFREGDPATKFYMLKRGKILLEKHVSEKMTIHVGSIKPGESFGWSALLEGGFYTADTICKEPCEVYSVEREKGQFFIDSHPNVGPILSQNLIRVIKNRLDHRFEQLIRVIKNHPDMQSLF